MKKIHIFKTILWAAAICLVWACGKDLEKGPIFKDSVAPSPVTEVVVTNTSGGAVITYQMPKDLDLLRVEASFMRGDQKIVKSSSIYSNKILIDGLKSGQTLDISVSAVDRSNNYSTPVKVTASPLRAPIDDLFDSFGLKEDFGGVRLSYNNKDLLQVEIQILKLNETNGLYQYKSSAFIDTDKKNGFSFRGFEDVPGKFAVVAIDRWNNISDTAFAVLTPIKEVKLDINKFKKISPAIPNDSPVAFGWVIENMWNNNNGGSGYHSAQDEPGGGSLMEPYNEPYPVISFDLGVTAYISRFKFWQRTGTWMYTHGNPRLFEVWGIDKIPAGYDGKSLTGWTRLVVDGEVIKPSGAPLGQNSAEDVASATSGEEFECADPGKPIRYIRFVNQKNWSGAKFMHIMEVNFWGNIIQ